MRSKAFNSEKVTLMPTTGIVAWHILAAMPYAVPMAQMSEMLSPVRSVGKEVLGKRSIVNSLNLYKK